MHIASLWALSSTTRRTHIGLDATASGLSLSLGISQCFCLDGELLWFLETAATHLICRASPRKFLSSICPIVSECYDLIKDSMSIANLGHNVGYLCAGIVVLTSKEMLGGPFLKGYISLSDFKENDE